MAAASERDSRERRLVAVTGLAAALPVMSAVLRGLLDDWVPIGDQAIVATRAHDVFTPEIPLVGLWSTASLIAGEPVFHPGPLLFWVLALPARIPWDGAFLLTIGALNIAAVMWTVALAHRRGGRALMFATAAALVLMLASLPIGGLREIWNPTAPLLAFTLLMFLCWSVACGDYRLLPAAVLVASFVMQCHLGFLLPCLAALATGVTFLVLTPVRPSRHAAPPGAGSSLRRWSVAALVIAVLAWSGPLIDQVLDWAGSDRGSGNLVGIVESAGAHGDTIGLKGGAFAVVRATAVPPWWLRAPQGPLERVSEVIARPPAWALLSSAVVGAGLIAALGAAARRRRRDIVTACVLALAMCAALAIVTASFPSAPERLFSYGHSSLWAAPAGMWVWLVVGWSALTLLGPRRLPMGRGLAMACLAALAGAGAVVAAGQGKGSDHPWYGPARTVVDQLETALPRPSTVRVDGAFALELQAPVIRALRRQGAGVRAVPDIAVQFGPGYELRDGPYEHVVDLRDGTAPPAGARLVARVRVGAPVGRTLVVSLRSPR